MDWKQTTEVGGPIEFVCGYCGVFVGSVVGWYNYEGGNIGNALVRVCPNCTRPTYFDRPEPTQVPAPAFGAPVEHLPTDVAQLYDQVRVCVGVAPTAAVLACRKILMHIAVEKGAKEGSKFVEYVEYLSAKGYVLPDGKNWVDHIREKGNDANHEIVLMTADDAAHLTRFAEMLLRFVYEMPKRVPPKKK